MKRLSRQIQVLLLVDLDYSYCFLEGAAAAGLTVHVIGIETFRPTVADFDLCSEQWVPPDAFHTTQLLPLVRSIMARIELANSDLMVVTLRERSVKMAAELATNAGCVGLSIRAATLFRDKWEMTRAVATLGIPTPETRLGSRAWIAEPLPETGVMLKPRRGSISLGLRACPDRSALETCLCELKDLDAYIAQTYIDGPMYFVDAVIYQGHTEALMLGKHIVPLGQVGRTPRSFMRSWASSAGVLGGSEKGHYPSDVLSLYHDRIARDFGLEYGCSHMEFFESDGKIIFCEAAARAGGPRILALQRGLWGHTMPAFFAARLAQAFRPLPASKNVVGMIDFVAEGPVRNYVFTHSLNVDWVLGTTDWDSKLVRGGHYTDPLKRILIEAPDISVCESRLAWLADGFQYELC